MWTPAINRDRRVALQDRRTRFFGTDFSFEDLDERDVDHYDYAMKGEETLDGERVLEDRVDAARGPPVAVHAVDACGSARATTPTRGSTTSPGDTMIRRIVYKDLQNVQGIWTARTLEMQDFTRNSRTILKMDSLDYNVPLRDDQFTLEALRRG